ncbi:hypothetical protein HNQ94_000068 [Salirhabdus euzebyi]|uniref:Lipoprotein n=1 Tax=Salirhabdus euzebyi TaxID=394506 RepID=A0A841PRU8_9BACI|nr:hypothetical protein [Salirhabdus euzebyi]MBB6451647.1 hypothetical protein [Salirhabdus euzebyi]
MFVRPLIVLLISILLGACSQQEVAPKINYSQDSPVTFEEVENVIKEEGLDLMDTELPANNVFVSVLNGVSPEDYLLEGTPLSIYVFPTATDRGKGIEQFMESTATAKLQEHKAFGINNVLLFYVGGVEELNNKLLNALTKLESPA